MYKKPTIMTDSNKQFSTIKRLIEKQWVYRETSETKLAVDLKNKLLKRQWILSIEFNIFDNSLIIYTMSDNIFTVSYKCKDNQISESELKKEK